MTTEFVCEIGTTSRDYSTMQAWEDDLGTTDLTSALTVVHSFDASSGTLANGDSVEKNGDATQTGTVVAISYNNDQILVVMDSGDSFADNDVIQKVGDTGNNVTLSNNSDDSVYVGDCFADSNFSAGVTITGATVDDTNYIKLTVSTDRHLGVPGDGVVIDDASEWVIYSSLDSTIVEWIEIDGGVTPSSEHKGGIRLGTNSTGAGSVARYCIIHDFHNSSSWQRTTGILLADWHSPGPTAESCILYNMEQTVTNTSVCYGIQMGAAGIAYYNTLYDITTYDGDGGGIELYDSASSIAQNNVIFECDVDYVYSSYAGTSSYNADSDGTCPGSNLQQNLTYTDEWTDPANGDFTVKASSNLEDNATPISGITKDIANEDRDGTNPTIGAFEYVSAGTPDANPWYYYAQQAAAA